MVVVATETCPYVCDRLPYGGSSVRAPLILYSQGTVRSRTKDQAVLRSDHAWDSGKVQRGLHRHGIAPHSHKAIVPDIP